MGPSPVRGDDASALRSAMEVMLKISGMKSKVLPCIRPCSHSSSSKQQHQHKYKPKNRREGGGDRWWQGKVLRDLHTHEPPSL